MVGNQPLLLKSGENPLISDQEPKESLPNPYVRSGYISNSTFESYEKRPKTVPISNVNVSCAAATGQREENRDMQLAE